MRKFGKILGLLAVGISAAACSATKEVPAQATHIDVERPTVVPEVVTQKLAVSHSHVASFQNATSYADTALSVAQTEAVAHYTPAPAEPAPRAIPIAPQPSLVSRAAPLADQPLAVLEPAPVSGFRIVDIQVEVPQLLTVSEADVWVPNADIVWREDPLGDRRAQVKRILTDALQVGTVRFDGGRPVILQARLGMFHALTERTRARIGGKHNIQFEYVLIDAATGMQLGEPVEIDASLKGFGGRRALEAEARGETQKVRITRHVAGVIYEDLKSRALPG